MISVLIADDDRIILESIVNQIDWKGLGYEVVGTANNGAQALSLLREKRPDLMIVDVVMPLMNGLEVIAAAKAEGIDTRMLVISSYEEFDYVKKAITLGAIGYVLKSELFGAQFMEKLEEIRQEISREWENRRNSERGLLERFFADTSDTVGGSGFIRADGLDESLYAKKGDFALFYEWAPIALKERRNPNGTEKARQERILDRCGQLPEIERSFFAGEMLVLGVEVGMGKPGLWHAVAEQLSSAFRREFSYAYIEVPLSIAELRNRVLDRMNRLQYLRHFKPTLPVEFGALTNGHEPLERFNFVAMLDDGLDVSAQLDQYLSGLSKARDFASVESFARAFVMQAEMLAGFEVEAEEYRFFDTWESLRDWCVELYNRCRHEANRSAEKQYSEPVAMAIAYIGEQYTNPELRIESIAQHTAMSMSRLQVLFKKETDKTISEYITDIRIREAARLLETTQMRVYEIAEAVGYSSSQYFSQVLLQRTGKKPLEYRRAAKPQ